MRNEKTEKNGKRKDSKGRLLRQNESERKDGRYMYRYTNEQGKRKVVYSTTLKELRRKEEDILKDRMDGILSEKGMTMDDIFFTYIDRKHTLKSATICNYRYLYEHYVRPELGRRQITGFCYSDICNFYNELAELGLSANTISNIHTLLHPIFDTAVKDRMIRANPTDGAMAEIRQSLGRRDPIRALTQWEQEKLMDFLRDSKTYGYLVPLFTVLLGTGCRIGEIIGLRWDDLDFEHGIIRIDHNCVYQLHGDGRAGFHITSPKTASGRREIPMISAVREAFYLERRRQIERGIVNNTVIYDDEGKPYSGFIFTNRSGGIYNPGTLNRTIRRIIKACNDRERIEAVWERREAVFLSDFSVHQLRHTFCTRFCENESNVKVIQEIMGHADVQTTLNIYADVTREKKQEVIGNLEGKLGI
ncbi:MAG: site-specific integrase [Lachnospiraceae bacterium]|nr:site-specific integrase [Lachnospiraceae bacterium]